MQRNKPSVDDSKACKNQTQQSIPFCFPPFKKGLQMFLQNLSLNLFSIDGSDWEKFSAGKSQVKSNQFYMQPAYKLAIF